MQIHFLEQDLKENFDSDPGVEPPWHGCELPIGTLWPINRLLEVELYILGQVECKYTI